MNREPIDPSDERLNALVDGELTAADAEQLLERMRADEALRDRVGRIQLGKALLRHAYAEPPPVPAASAPVRRSRPRVAALAASLALGVGLALGWVASERIGGAGRSWPPAAAEGDTLAATDRIVLHLGSGSPQAGRAVLDRAEGILDAAAATGRPVSVEIVANGGGLDLLREGVSPHAARIVALRAAHPGLALVACGQTAQRLRDHGVEVRLLAGTREATSALDEIVLRMQQGWTYLRI